MKAMPEPGMHGHNTFWINSQVSFTFAIPDDTTENIIEAINLPDLAAFLDEHGFVLSFLADSDNQSAQNARTLADYLAAKNLPSDQGPQNFPGIYVFPGPLSPQDRKTRFVVAFFQFNEASETTADALQARQEKPGSHQYHIDNPKSQPVPRLVNLVNSNLEMLMDGKITLDNGRALKPIPITSAAPHWLCGSSDNVTTGCPLMPPFPVPAEHSCSSSYGLWPISLPQLPNELKGATGDDVTVLVMDTLPPVGHIRRAAEAAGAHNLLLLDVMNNVTFTHPHLPDVVDLPNPQRPQTGKDLYGRSMRFHMPDHGLFVTGIIRDIAPDTRVECIRVLNDVGAGATQTLIEQFQRILQRIAAGGDLYNKDVVVNLSLVIPGDEDIQDGGFDPGLVRTALREVIRSLTSLGVVFVAAAGNEGDDRQQQGQTHPRALYPAAFANEGIDNIVPVGAVNEQEQASSFSCYPGEKGIATYGGEIPGKGDIYKEHGMTKVDTNKIDALIGIYTQLHYPALSITDEQATYSAPNTYGWAYWIGTSFATPIVTAVVARALELRRTPPEGFAMGPLRDYIVDRAATAQIEWKNVASSAGSLEGRMIVAKQCRCRERMHEQEEHGHREEMEGATTTSHS